MLKIMVRKPDSDFLRGQLVLYLKFPSCSDAEAAKKAFDAKVKENDDFVAKMKKEIDQAEKRAKEKKALEKSLHHYKETVKENEASIAKLESDLAKLSELRTKEEKDHKAELESTRKSVKDAKEYCARRFAVFSETLSGEA